MSKKLSLIIPCYNEEEVIELSINTMIESLKDIKETYELIFVDDGSKDRTLEILKNLALNNKNIKVNDYNVYFNEDDNLVSDHHLVMVDIDI